ncbi:MAG: hypothetical protein M3463_06770 [Verrucomicrobiota bacterium]|nr:hypothetical protein [Verrucomicrobiota bacterium]
MKLPLLSVLVLTAVTPVCSAAEPSAAKLPAIELGSRRELFVDEFLIERLSGATLILHQPEPRDVALVCDAAWEGNTSAYYTLFEDDGLFRMYYRASHVDENRKPTHPELTCYAESRDGITWVKPKLGLFEFGGSKENNIIWNGPGGTHNFAPFKDTNPACQPEARYKALAGGTALVAGKKKSCLHAYHSADGVRWSKTREEPVITDGAFDSQNIAFFDGVRGEYRAYWRYFFSGPPDDQGRKPPGVRAIRTATSKVFLHWENQADLSYGDAPPEHLYTNAILPYARAPHLFIGFPTRFQAKTQQVEPVLMTSRDAVNFKRWPTALIPITAPKDRDGNRSNYMTRGLLQLPGNDRELSVYATEAYYAGPGSRVRRFVFRMDGFVSVRASAGGGEFLTKPLTFTGSALSLNITSKGATRVEVQDANGRPLPGFAAEDCTPITGDSVAHTVVWNGGDLCALAGQPVRLHFVLKDADLFALQFQPKP